MFKRSDSIIISIICFFLGVFIVSQYFASKAYRTLTQPENNATLALEVAKLTKVNASLRKEATDLTEKLDVYSSTSESGKKVYDQYQSDSAQMDVINGVTAKTGQGVIITIDGVMGRPQVVDLVNALKNIGAEIIQINGSRLIVSTNLDQFANQSHYEIKVIGNSKILKSAVERKGGIMEQISANNLRFDVAEKESIDIAPTEPLKIQYSRAID